MKRTVWATGLFAAMVATGVWSLPIEKNGKSDAATFADVISEGAEAMQSRAGAISTSVPTLEPDMDLVSRGIFECEYHDNPTSSTQKVLVRGSGSCGFLDGSEGVDEKAARIAHYVYSYVPGVFQPEKTICRQVLTNVEDEHRKHPMSGYIVQMNKLPSSSIERYELQGKALLRADKADKVIRKDLQGDVLYALTEHNQQSCNLLLVVEDAPGQSNSGIRGCSSSCLHGAGMVLSCAGSWFWHGFKISAEMAPWAYLTNWVTTTPGWDAATDKILFGEVAKNITSDAGGLYGAWSYELSRTRAGTPNAVSDVIVAVVAGVLGRIYLNPYISAGTIYALELLRLKAKNTAKKKD